MCLLNFALAGSMFLAPVGIQNLLEYLEQGGAKSSATVRPWVWILWIAIGPFMRSLCMEWYLFYSQRTITRGEAIITQLVFQQSLRLPLNSDILSGSGSDAANRQDAGSSDNESTLTAVSTLAETEDLTTVGEEVVEHAENQRDTLSSAATAAAQEKPQTDAAKQMAGRINNLVTSDLSNIAGGADFMLLRE
jgi:hypothetical protein